MRRLIAAGSAVALLLAIAPAVAQASPADPCEQAYTAPMNSTAKLKAYLDCRLDRLDSRVGVYPVPGPTVTATVEVPGPTATATATVTVTASSTPTPSVTPTPTATATVTQDPPASLLDLPRIAWEGGPDYWAQFPDASDWTDPSFFPIGIWFNGLSTDAQAQWDKAHGINTYVGMDPSTDFALFERNGLYWLGPQRITNAPEHSENWPGVFLADEPDGVGDASGITILEAAKAQAPAGKFTYANYTQIVIENDLAQSISEAYVNFPDAVSADQYFYTTPWCDWSNFRGSARTPPIDQATCRTASSYGKMLDTLTRRDAADGILSPRWGFVENFNGMPSGDQSVYMTADQAKGAAMNSIIHEARGLFWFNQSFSGSCRSSAVLRDAQVQGSGWCGSAAVEGMGEVNNLVHALAPVINTQSYQWKFGDGLDTMLKAYDGYAYVFAMTDGTTGSRTFTLPSGISGTSVEVLNEGRTLTVDNGTFSDNFAAENTYHIYRIKI